MHVPRAVRLYLSTRSRSPNESARETRRSNRYGCPSCLEHFSGQKLHVWCPLALLVIFSIVGIGIFESIRLSTHVLQSPCTILRSELADVGTCLLCDGSVPSTCEVHPIATARLTVTFRHLHLNENITGSVWYCKNRVSEDPCTDQVGFLDQLSLDDRSRNSRYRSAVGGPIPCTTAEVLQHVRQQVDDEPRQATCYYSSQDLKGEDVWLSVPSAGLVDHAWFQSHLEYPVLVGLGGLVMLTLLMGLLAVEGAELYFSGLV